MKHSNVLFLGAQTVIEISLDEHYVYLHFEKDDYEVHKTSKLLLHFDGEEIVRKFVVDLFQCG